MIEFSLSSSCTRQRGGQIFFFLFFFFFYMTVYTFRWFMNFWRWKQPGKQTVALEFIFQTSVDVIDVAGFAEMNTAGGKMSFSMRGCLGFSAGEEWASSFTNCWEILFKLIGEDLASSLDEKRPKFPHQNCRAIWTRSWYQRRCHFRKRKRKKKKRRRNCVGRKRSALFISLSASGMDAE